MPLNKKIAKITTATIFSIYIGERLLICRTVCLIKSGVLSGIIICLLVKTLSETGTIILKDAPSNIAENPISTKPNIK